MSNDLILKNRGLGLWEIELYNPPSKKFKKNGWLFITKDHYTIYKDANLKKILLIIPSQNVSWTEFIDVNYEF